MHLWPITIDDDERLIPIWWLKHNGSNFSDIMQKAVNGWILLSCIHDNCIAEKPILCILSRNWFCSTHIWLLITINFNVSYFRTATIQYFIHINYVHKLKYFFFLEVKNCAIPHIHINVQSSVNFANCLRINEHCFQYDHFLATLKPTLNCNISVLP